MKFKMNQKTLKNINISGVVFELCLFHTWFGAVVSSAITTGNSMTVTNLQPIESGGTLRNYNFIIAGSNTPAEVR